MNYLRFDIFHVCSNQRDIRCVERVMATFPQGTARGFPGRLNRSFWLEQAAQLKGDEAEAQAAFTAAREVQEQNVQEFPDDPMVVAGLAWIDAELKRKEDALREGHAAVEMATRQRDFLEGST